MSPLLGVSGDRTGYGGKPVGVDDGFFGLHELCQAVLQIQVHIYNKMFSG